MFQFSDYGRCIHQKVFVCFVRGVLYVLQYKLLYFLLLCRIKVLLISGGDFETSTHSIVKAVLQRTNKIEQLYLRVVRFFKQCKTGFTYIHI